MKICRIGRHGKQSIQPKITDVQPSLIERVALVTQKEQWMYSIQKDAQEFHGQLGSGAIQRAYRALLSYVMELRIYFWKKYPDSFVIWRTSPSPQRHSSSAIWKLKSEQEIMREIKYRQAVEKDISRIVELWEEFIDFHKVRDSFFSRSKVGPENFGKFVGQNLRNQDAIVYVAEKRWCRDRTHPCHNSKLSACLWNEEIRLNQRFGGFIGIPKEWNRAASVFFGKEMACQQGYKAHRNWSSYSKWGIDFVLEENEF